MSNSSALTGRRIADLTAEVTVNISSIVVRTLPENLAEVCRTLTGSGLCEIHFQDEQGRVVVTIEGGDVDEEMHILQQIQALPNVLSADLVYAYSEQGFTTRPDAVPPDLSED